MNISCFNVLLLSSCLYLSVCNTTVREPPPLALANHPTFNRISVETELEIFKLDKTITSQLDAHLTSKRSAHYLANSILSFLLKNGDNSLTYQSGATLSASQTYANLNANCLSLSILAYSLADYLGIKTRFQKVHIPEYWAMNKGVNLLTGHINLSIDNALMQTIPATMVYQRDKQLTIDFDPNIRKQRFKTSPISKEFVTAMFYNNKGAQALVNKNYNLAYSYFSAAVEAAPLYSGGWGNLGIVFRQLNYLKEAEQAYNYALLLDKNNHTAIGNLAVLYTLSNRAKQGQQMLKQLNKKRQANPYYHISLGNSELVLKNYSQAIKHFKSAYKIDAKLHESHFGLARAYYFTGNIKQATHYMRLAGINAEFNYDKARYRNKLKALKNATASLSH